MEKYLECTECNHIFLDYGDENDDVYGVCPNCDKKSDLNILEESEVIKEYAVSTSITYNYESIVRANNIEEAKEKFIKGNYLSRDEVDISGEEIYSIDINKIYSKHNTSNYIIKEDIVLSKKSKIKSGDIYYMYEYIGCYIDEIGRKRYIFRCTECGAIKACAISTVRESYSFKHNTNGTCKVNKQNTVPNKILREIELYF